MPLSVIMWQLDRIYGDLGLQAEDFFVQSVGPAVARGLYVSPSCGSNYTTTVAFNDRRMLALQLFFDAVVTTRNALGRAAVVTRKYNVLSVRVANVPSCMRDSNCILPIAIVPPAAWAKYGFDGIIEALLPDFQRLETGMHFTSLLSVAYL